MQQVEKPVILNQPSERPIVPNEQKPLYLDKQPQSLPQPDTRSFVAKHSPKEVKSAPQTEQRTPKNSPQMEQKAANVIRPKEEPKISPKQEPVRMDNRSKQDKYDEKRYHQKITHEEKSMYDTQPKVHMDSEALLANAMASQNYHLSQAPMYQWQRERLAWSIYYDPKRDYTGYPVLPQFPPLDMLPKQPSCEKEKVPPNRTDIPAKVEARAERSSKLKGEQDAYSQVRTSEAGSKNSSIRKKSDGKGKLDQEEHQKLDSDVSHQQMQPSIKHTPPTPSGPDMPSMGVYTPDSTTNSVHSLHYGQCELDVAQLGLESPASISSDMASQNSVEPVRPPSVAVAQQQPPPPQTNYDCSVQHNMQQTMQQQTMQTTAPASSPSVNQVTAMQMSQQQQQQQQQQTNPSNCIRPPPASGRSSSSVAIARLSMSRRIGRGRRHPSAQQQQLQHMQASPTTHHQSMQQQHHGAQQLQQHLHHQVAARAPGISVSPGRVVVAASTQAFPSQATSTYVNVPMTTVIQHRMSAQQSGVSPLGTLGAVSHQKLAPSPSCAVTSGTNFYIQTNPHTHAHTPASGNSSCSLAKLQQLTNGLDMIPPTACNTMTPPPPTAMTLTPPPTHHPHATMTPPPSHQMIQNQTVRNLTPPSAIPPNLQQQVLGYHKYYQTNMNVNQLGGTVTPPIGQNLGRSGRNSTNVAAMQHMQTSTSRVSPNVTLNPNVMYNMNSYRMAPQQAPSAVTGYITNTAGFINNQIPMQMMNMAQTQYQDPAALQRAQQNTMYTACINGIMPLNGTMRR
ncbi:hypothetical protein NQ318_007966 [Aromia moschata]|uniref:Uncharacterized protein n=1 Tax=Aromia moschata TaxID=1265417 RepID=A0AAV8YD30_9CUCU|nr:hypothetical protein NQ318_007966 [Aromia moschata]